MESYDEWWTKQRIRRGFEAFTAAVVREDMPAAGASLCEVADALDGQGADVITSALAAAVAAGQETARRSSVTLRY